MSDEKEMQQQDADLMIANIAGMLLNAADVSTDDRIKKLADTALEMVTKSGAVREILKKNSEPKPPSPAPMPSTIAATARQNQAELVKAVQQLTAKLEAKE